MQFRAIQPRNLGVHYLTGNTNVLLDTNTSNYILEVQQLPDDVKDKLFYFIDMTVRDYKAKQAYKWNTQANAWVLFSSFSIKLKNNYFLL